MTEALGWETALAKGKSRPGGGSLPEDPRLLAGRSSVPPSVRVPFCSLGSHSVQTWGRKEPPEKKASLELTRNRGGWRGRRKEEGREGKGAEVATQERRPCHPGL